MSLLILCDPRYRHNNWCDTKLRGIYDDAARRRIPVKLYTDFVTFESAAAKLGRDSSVILLFNSLQYLAKAAEVLENMEIHPILSVTESDILFPRAFSQVCGDVDSATKEMVRYLHKKGKRRIAVLGSSETSAAGRNKVEMLRRYVPQEEYAVFTDRGNLLQSFEEFFLVREQFDAAVCINDHQAISLIEFLQSKGGYDPSLCIISHGDTILARLYGDGISTISTGFYACGKAMVEAHVQRRKYDWSTVMIRVPCVFSERGSSNGTGVYPSVSAPLEHANQSAIVRLERMLADCDQANLKLVIGLLSGYSYERMGELCFLSAGAVKYRMQRMREILGSKTREEMAALLGRYIEKEKLLLLLEQMEDVAGKVFLQ